MPIVRDYTAVLSRNTLHGSQGKGAFYTHSFLESIPDYYESFPAAGRASFRPLTEAERQAARKVLDAWASKSGLTFFEVSGAGGDMVFGAYEMDLMFDSNAAGRDY